MQNNFHRHLNSSIIKERHKKVYEELFQNCPIVVSAPAVYPLSPTYAVGPGGIGLVSKLPFRMYLGIEPKSSGGIKFGPTLNYLPEQDKFVEWESTKCNPIYLKILENFASQHGKKIHARLWSITEIPWYRGLNIDSMYATACSAAWFLRLGLIGAKDLEKLLAQPSESLNKSKEFDSLFRFAAKLESTIADWVADAHMVFASLIKSNTPTIFFRERDPILFDHYQDLGITNPNSFYNVFDKLSYCGLRLNEALKADFFSFWPIDMALIFTGDEVDARVVYPTRKAISARLSENALFAKDKLENLVPKTFGEPPKFLKMMKENEKYSLGMNLFRTYRNNSVVHSITVLKTVYNLLLYSSAPYAIHEFIEAQNINQDILRLLGLSPLATDHIATTIREIGLRTAGTGIATRLVGTGGGGCLMVFGLSNTLETVLNNALPILQSTTKKPIHCHWASWCDGNLETNGVIVEQHLEEKVYAEAAPRESLNIFVWCGGEKNSLVSSPEKLKKEIKKFDLLLDAENKKIFVKGKALGSTQIHSTKQTIELFEILSARKTGMVRGEELPPSSYRSDRNQMESKIIRPLTKTFKKITGQNLGLEIHGHVGSEYEIKFAPLKSVKIGLVKQRS